MSPRGTLFRDTLRCKHREVEMDSRSSFEPGIYTCTLSETNTSHKSARLFALKRRPDGRVHARVTSFSWFSFVLGAASAADPLAKVPLTLGMLNELSTRGTLRWERDSACITMHLN